MAKTLLSLMLMLTQLLSWSTSSVYVCIDGNGAVHLDGGPNSCDCCQHDAHDDHDGDHHACSAGHACSEKHDHELPSPDSSDLSQVCTLVDSGCDCLHIQIVSQQQPTTRHSVTALDSAQQDFVVPLANTLPTNHPTCSQVESAAGPFRAASSFALLERATVCLRC